MSTVAAVDDRERARHWLFLALASLGLAGVLACGLVFARMPLLATLVTDPGFFKRCLVVHVDLALVVWFHAFAAALFALIPTRVRSNPLARGAPLVTGFGMALMLFAAGVNGARPILANYVPVIDHPVYVIGLGAVGLGLALTLLDVKLLPGAEAPLGPLSLPPAALVALRTAGVCILLALATFVSTALAMPAGLSPEAYWELVMWGGGHVLQFASVAAMLAVWTVLVAQVVGFAPISRGAALAICAWLSAPLLASPLLPLFGPTTAAYHLSFTRLMQFCIAPPVLAWLWLSIRSVRHASTGDLRSGAFLGFSTSAALTVAGFLLGASIRGPNTTIPAHYHASIGAVTVSFMALTVPLMKALGYATPSRRVLSLARVQPMLLGFGQLVFAIGFALAGAHGMRRKAYGGEQQIRTLTEWLGLGVMGIGGLVAVAGGVLFLVVVFAVWRGRRELERGEAWLQLPNTRFSA